MRILVIDDDERLARAVKRSLTGHDVSIETVPQDAIALAETADVEGVPFEAVVCDLRMPRMNGLDLLMTLRSMRVRPVLLLMSGDDDILDPSTIADVVLVKPFRVCEIVDAIRRVKLQRSRRQTRRFPRALRAMAEPRPVKATVEIPHRDQAWDAIS